MKMRLTSPIWENENIIFSRFDNLTADLYVDVAIVGAGITGLSAALQLAEAGKRVAVFELGNIGQGSTGHSTGHLSSLADTAYHHLEAQFGEENTPKIARSMTEGIQNIYDTCTKYGIECDFQWLDGYLYTEKEIAAKALSEEMLAARKAGLAIKAEKPALPFTIAGAFKVERQAQFHPLKYVMGLAANFRNIGGLIYENKPIRRMEEGETCTLETDTHKVYADKVIMATHTPLSMNPVQSEVFPYISYCLAIKALDVQLAPGLYCDTEEPYHYTRSYHGPEGDLLLIGGYDHKSGHVVDTDAHYQQLEDYARQHYGNIQVVNKWSGQYYKSADGLPYIGYSAYSTHTLLATGYSGDGLVWGTVAARILSDLILEKENPYTKLYSAKRLNILASAKEVFKENMDAVMQLIGGIFKNAEELDLENITPGQGKIVSTGTKKLAVYRDDEGKYFAMSPICPHLGCHVQWNSSEKGWDCPCHGSRYDAKGKLLYGPAMHDLTQKELKS